MITGLSGKKLINYLSAVSFQPCDLNQKRFTERLEVKFSTKLAVIRVIFPEKVSQHELLETASLVNPARFLQFLILNDT